MSIDERLEQKKLELYEKHRLDGCMSDEEVANEIRSLRSNKVRHQLLNDFKVQLKVSFHKNSEGVWGYVYLCVSVKSVGYQDQHAPWYLFHFFLSEVY